MLSETMGFPGSDLSKFFFFSEVVRFVCNNTIKNVLLSSLCDNMPKINVSENGRNQHLMNQHHKGISCRNSAY